MEADHLRLDGPDSVDPFELFAEWHVAARVLEGERADAMSLGTVDAEGRPSNRMVLLRGASPAGFVFYTDGESRKGRELRATARAALCLWWPALGRQVRVEGRVEAVDAAESDAYWHGRPRDARLAGFSSRQSEPTTHRQALESRMSETRHRFAGEEVPRPERWGGFRVVPDSIELWAEGAWRLHDRWRFERETPDAPWRRTRLQP